MQNSSDLFSAHETFPLTRSILDRLSLTPEYDYLESYNARQLNARLEPPLQPYTAGEITAIGLIGKIFLYMIDYYRQSTCPAVFEDLDIFLQRELGTDLADKALDLFLGHFPTTPSYYTPPRAVEYFLSYGISTKLRHSFYHSVILILSAESNFAIRSKDGFITDPVLRGSSLYRSLKNLFEKYFSLQPGIGESVESLLDFLNAPAKAFPKSIFDQLKYIQMHWVSYLGESYLLDLLKALDHLNEEATHGLSGPGPPQNPLGFARASYQTDNAVVRFSPDLDWMPKAILIAKNIFVWLDQLSKQYQRPIHRLEHIPDQELEKLATWGITGLWLIGLWQRSEASQKIKQFCGNSDAVSSAYSLYDYVIAESLGGESSFQNLRQRSARYGIRLAADMVPNHMGIVSKWVIEHPDWFISLDNPPFPGYTFHGSDLSDDQNIGIFLEDHYYDKTDASIVFKRLDKNSGSSRYIYHGNDGTAMPWNDTAQLDFLNPEVREAVIQTILHVASKFPIIRFDAAMTLTKKHFQRLWFPEPGTGGAIPTRSDYGLSKSDFDRSMPEEFWREVVDRVAQEAPDTLLLAEAFWMMEGFFVRSLGMHRVYNSAFMHMLRDEDNAEYRELIIKTLAYDPQILKRYVNFMNNPDEDSAITQFGSDGKYFGICILMTTLPGLPMFGHGQIEGFAEKYGMEYQRAYYNEQENQFLIDRHQKEIFPLLHKRYLFAEVEYFTLYNMNNLDGSVNENVYAYSNRSGDERALVLYQNNWGTAQGNIHYSANINQTSISLLDGLGFNASEGDYLLFKEQISGLEYIRSIQDLSSRGLSVSLGAYQYQVFLDFKLVPDKEGTYRQLAEYLNGNGVFSLQETLLDIKYTPLANIYTKLLLRYQNDQLIQPEGSEKFTRPRRVVTFTFADLLPDLWTICKQTFPDFIINQDISNQVIFERLSLLNNVSSLLDPDRHLLFNFCFLSWIFAAETQAYIPPDLLLYLPVLIAKHTFFDQPEYSEIRDEYSKNLGLLFTLASANINLESGLLSVIELWFNHPVFSHNLDIHSYDGHDWYKKEALEILLDLTLGLIYLQNWDLHKEISSQKNTMQILKQWRKMVRSCMKKSKYQVVLFQELITSTVPSR